MCKVTLYINVVCRCLISPVVSLGQTTQSLSETNFANACYSTDSQV